MRSEGREKGTMAEWLRKKRAVTWHRSCPSSATCSWGPGPGNSLHSSVEDHPVHCQPGHMHTLNQYFQELPKEAHVAVTTQGATRPFLSSPPALKFSLLWRKELRLGVHFFETNPVWFPTLADTNCEFREVFKIGMIIRLPVSHQKKEKRQLDPAPSSCIWPGDWFLLSEA